MAAISRCTRESVLACISTHRLDSSLPVAIDTAQAAVTEQAIDEAQSTYEQYHAPGERLPRATLSDGDGKILWQGHPLDKKLESLIVRIFEADPDMRGRNYKRLRALERIQASWRDKQLSTSTKMLASVGESAT
jgi:hypothetical protein